MREVVTGRVNRRIAALALVAVAAVCVLAALPRRRSASRRRPSRSSAASASPSPEPVAPTLSAALSAASVVFGEQRHRRAARSSRPPRARRSPSRSAASTSARCPPTRRRAPTRSPSRRAAAATWSCSLTADPAVAAAPLALAVKPKVTISHGTLVPFLPSRFVVKVAPTAYDGVIVLKVVHRRALVGTYRARVKDGRAVFQAPLRGVDGFTLTYVLPAAGGLTGRTVQSKVSVRARTLSAGVLGPLRQGDAHGAAAPALPRPQRRLQLHRPGQGLGDGLPEGLPPAAHLRLQQRRAGASWTGPRSSSRATRSPPRTSRSTRPARSS